MFIQYWKKMVLTQKLNSEVIIISLLAGIPFFIGFIIHFIFHTDGWHTPWTQYQIIFWFSKWIATPGLLISTTWCWQKGIKPSSWIFIMLMAYLVAQGISSFILCRVLVRDDGRIWNLAQTIVRQSSPIDIAVFFSTVFVFQARAFPERMNSYHPQRMAKQACPPPTPSSAINPEYIASGHPELRHFTIKTGLKSSIVPVQSILLIAADGPYVKIFANDGKNHLLQLPLHRLEKVLPAIFIRIHRCHIINSTCVMQIRSVGNGDSIVVMQNGTEIRASRTYRGNLRSFLTPAGRFVS